MSTRISHFMSALLGGAVVAGAVVALALAGVFDDGDDDSERSAGVQAQPAAASGGRPTNVAGIYERASDSVVQIETTRGGRERPQLPFPDPRLPDPRQGPPEGAPRGGTGSGFVLDREGHIVTNDHVVEGAREVEVRFAGEDVDPVDAKVVGTDPSTDLAVVKVDPEDVEGGLNPLPLGSSEQLRVGEATIAMGSPFGLSGTLTTGVVSALGRTIPAPNDFSIEDVIQTDAAINPGNSGGPLLDAQGRVIGINAQIATNGAPANSGVGFAVPVDTAKEVVPTLIDKGKVVRPWLGVSTAEITEDVAKRLELDSRDGAVVAQVVPEGPAAAHGIRPRDVIVAVNGKPVENPEDVVDLVGAADPGDEVKIEVLRDGKRRTIDVTLGTRPNQIRE